MERFKQRVIEAYGGDFYDFSKVVFVGNNTPVTVTCPDHGDFTITPDNLIYNAGCKSCRGVHKRGYPVPVRERSPNRGNKTGPKPAEYNFYIHYFGEDYLKIGITCGCVEARRIQIERASKFNHTLVYTRSFTSKRLCLTVEKAIKASFPMRVLPAGQIADGHTETTYVRFLADIIALVEAFPSKPYK